MTNVLNMELVHAEHGTGRLKEFRGKFIVVRFQDGETFFWFPEVFRNGELRTMNEADEAAVQTLIERWEAVFTPEETEEYKAWYYLALETERRKTLAPVTQEDEEKYQELQKLFHEARARAEEVRQARFGKDKKGGESTPA